MLLSAVSRVETNSSHTEAPLVRAQQEVTVVLTGTRQGWKIAGAQLTSENLTIQNVARKSGRHEREHFHSHGTGSN